MGWVLAFLFAVVAGVALLMLFNIWRENVALHARLKVLEPQAAARNELQAERDKIAAAYNRLRKRVQGIVDADAERARVIAESKAMAEKFNAQLAAAKSQFTERKQAMDTELATLEATLTPLRAEHRERRSGVVRNGLLQVSVRLCHFRAIQTGHR
jgi:peptidoglycan hydrolase CwlO-like protein